MRLTSLDPIEAKKLSVELQVLRRCAQVHGMMTFIDFTHFGPMLPAGKVRASLKQFIDDGLIKKEHTYNFDNYHDHKHTDGSVYKTSQCYSLTDEGKRLAEQLDVQVPKTS